MTETSISQKKYDEYEEERAYTARHSLMHKLGRTFIVLTSDECTGLLRDSAHMSTKEIARVREEYEGRVFATGFFLFLATCILGGVMYWLLPSADYHPSFLERVGVSIGFPGFIAWVTYDVLVPYFTRRLPEPFTCIHHVEAVLAFRTHRDALRVLVNDESLVSTQAESASLPATANTQPA